MTPGRRLITKKTLKGENMKAAPKLSLLYLLACFSFCWPLAAV